MCIIYTCIIQSVRVNIILIVMLELALYTTTYVIVVLYCVIVWCQVLGVIECQVLQCGITIGRIIFINKNFISTYFLFSVHSANLVKITDFGLSKLLDINEAAFQAAGGKVSFFSSIFFLPISVFTHSTIANDFYIGEF